MTRVNMRNIGMEDNHNVSPSRAQILASSAFRSTINSEDDDLSEEVLVAHVVTHKKLSNFLTILFSLALLFCRFRVNISNINPLTCVRFVHMGVC